MSIYQQAVILWGEEIQIDIAIEEMAELAIEMGKLTQLLIKYKRYGHLPDYNKDDLLGEIADVQLTLNQMKTLVGEDEVACKYLEKKERFIHRLNRSLEKKE